MGNQTPMAQGRSARFISMIKWIQTSRLSTKKTVSHCAEGGKTGGDTIVGSSREGCEEWGGGRGQCCDARRYRAHPTWLRQRPSGFDCSYHRRTPRRSVERIRKKTFPSFGSRSRVSRIAHPTWLRGGLVLQAHRLSCITQL